MSMLSHGHSLARILFYNLIVWNAWVLFAFGIRRLTRRIPLAPLRAPSLLLHLLAGCVVGLLHAAWWVSCMLVIRPYDHMNPTDFAIPFLGLAGAQLPLELLLYALVAFAAHAEGYYAQYRERETRAAQLEKSLAEARLHALELQIQPHFLFNTLNTVTALVRTGRPDEAVAVIAGLSDLLRYALDRAGTVTLAEEAEMVTRYLEIQRLRFSDRLTFDIDVDEDTRGASVPVLLLQPLAENAIRHGIAPSAGPGRVAIHAARDNGTLRIEMFNSGHLAVPMRHGIGLSNTIARLQQLYGADQGFEIRDGSEGVTTVVTIPWSAIS
jgi:hypothetical protein